jgi:hypothetical protein
MFWLSPTRDAPRSDMRLESEQQKVAEAKKAHAKKRQ